MNILKRSTLEKFWEEHANAEQSLKAWFKHVEQAQWKNTHDVKQDYRTADFLADNRIVFNIKGNDYRLIAKINYERSQVYIKFIGTHSEYDKIDANSVDQF